MEFTIKFFSITGILFSIIAIIAGLFSVLKVQSMLLYLKKNNYARWRDITTLKTPLGEFGPGTGNPSKLFEYIRSDMDNNDEKVLRFKDSIRIGMRYMGIFIVATLSVFVGLLLMVMK